MHIVAWVERSEFRLRTAISAIKQHKNIHGTHLCDRLAKQSQHLPSMVVATPGA
jgi:hypothetical protein